MSKTHWKKMHNYNYIGAYSIDPDQGYLILTIDRVVTEMVTGSSGSKESCMVCYFRGDTKPMILNKTNSKAIEAIAGSPFIEDWAGLQVKIITATVRAFGTTTDALRIDMSYRESIDVSDWTKKINSCTTKAQLGKLFRENQAKLSSNKAIMAEFTNRKKQLNNE